MRWWSGGDAANWVAEHLRASSRRPRHPFPALMAGVNYGRVPVYTALPAHHEQASRDRPPSAKCNCEISMVCRTGLTMKNDSAPRREVNLHDQNNRDIDHRVQELQSWNHHGLLNSKTMEICLCPSKPA